MAIVFVDTNIVINYIKERDNEKLVSFIDSFDKVYINDVVIMELYQGARDKKELNYIKKKIMKFEVLNMNQEIISLARKILDRYTLSHNTKIMDALIASTVIMYNIDLYTLNKKDFKYLKQVILIDP
ncbi:MAG TPA: type II toxin-antitoxin system VapC family toxin [Campylobacterales bacterium]|nr:type II toxin-antitoxin system VapC family toxin [Campylobacterales bacterium]